jgi:hypothetical protein
VRIRVLIAAAVLLAASAGDGAAKGEGPTSIAAGFGSLWVGMGSGEVFRFDAESGKQEARLGGGNTFVHGLATGYDGLWVVRNRLSRVDPRHNVTRDVAGTASTTAFAVATGAGSVWIADDGSNEIVQIEPDRARVVARIRVPGRAWGVAAGPRNVIVVSVPTAGPVSGPGGTRLLRRLDPQTSKLSAPLARLTCDAGVLVGSQAVWTLNACTGVLARRDPHTLAVRRQRPMHVLSQTPALGFGSLWLARRGGTLRVDPTTLRVLAEIPARSVAVTVGARYVWALDVGGAGRRPAVWRIDPRTNRASGPPILLTSSVR